MNPFAPSPGVQLHLLDDEAIVYDDAAQKIHALNTTAAFIWCSFELGADQAETTHALSTNAGITPADAARHVADSLAQWQALGLVNAAAKSRPVPQRPAQQETIASAPPLREGPRAAVHVYKLLGTHVRVRYETLEQEAWVHPALAHLETAQSAPDVTMDFVSGPQGHNLYRDGTPVFACAALDQLTPSIKSWVWIIAVNRHSYFLNIHAGVVGDGTSVTLLPGVAGSGKSSLTAALSRSGFDCLSDEVALLEEPAMTVRPVRLALCVKSTGWDLIEPYFPELRTAKTHRRGDGKIVRYVPPPAFTHGTRFDQTYPVRRIIFPRYVPGSQTKLTPVRRVDALRRLLEDCLAMPVPLTPLRVERLVTWIKSVDCAELIESSLTEAIALVHGAHGLDRNRSDRLSAE